MQYMYVHKAAPLSCYIFLYKQRKPETYQQHVQSQLVFLTVCGINLLTRMKGPKKKLNSYNCNCDGVNSLFITSNQNIFFPFKFLLEG